MLFTSKSVSIQPLQQTNVKTYEQLQQKLFYLQITTGDFERIKKLDKLIAKHAEQITKRHYDLLSQIPQLQQMMSKHSTIERLSQTFIAYLNSIPQVEMDEEYLLSRQKIGFVHSHIQLAPEWFIGAFTRIYEYLMPHIVSDFSSKAAGEVMLALNRILTLDAMLVLEAYQEAHEYRFIETNSQIVEELIQLDKVKPLLEGVSRTVSESMSVSAASEQLSASVEEVAEHAVQVAEKTEELIVQASTGQQVIQRSLNGFLTVVEDFSETKSRLDDLFSAFENVTEVVQMIREVADQTNLLALNAAIEAARAGEEGRGFAVVAGEVRKLSEQTKESVESITQMIENVRSSASVVSDKTNAMTDHVKLRVHETEEAMSSLDLIMKQVGEIGDLTGNIAAIVEQQSAATQDISDRTVEVLKQTEDIYKNASETGRDLYEVSVSVDSLRQKSLKYMAHLSNNQLLRVVKTDHLLWKWWVYNSVLGFHQIDSAQVADHHQCRLGKWYDENKKKANIAALPAFQALEEPHVKIHQLAKQASEWLKSEDHGQAVACLAEIDRLSKLVVQAIDQLQQELPRM